MGREYLIPIRSPPSIKRFSHSASSRLQQQPLRKVKPNYTHPKKKLPLRQKMAFTNNLRRHAIADVHQQFRRAASEPLVPSALEEFGVPNHPTIPSLTEVSKKRAREPRTQFDEALYAKRLKISAVSISNDVLTKQSVIPSYFVQGLTRHQKEALSMLRLDSDRMPASSQKGMKNPGVLCYRLSLLQSLLHLPGFVNWVFDYLKPSRCLSDHVSDCISCSLYQLATAYWSLYSDLGASLREFNNVLKNKGWSTDTSNGQGDPDELMKKLLQLLQTELPTAYFFLLDSTISIRYSQVIECPCGHRSITPNLTTNNLTLAMQPKKPSLTDYIQQEMQNPNCIEGYKCVSCKKSVKAHMYSEVTRFPEILSVQLTRVDYTNKKNNSAVKIPPTLNLNKYAVQDDKSGQYELVAVIKHRGTPSSGHYICAARGPDGKWHSFDDQSVRKTTVEEASKNSGGMTPSIMYYQKKRV